MKERFVGSAVALTIYLGLMLSGFGGAAAEIPPTLVINEIDYDQPGTDTAEFIELMNAGSASINLDGYSLELLNGTGGGATRYALIDLPNVELGSGGHYVVCANTETVANCDLDVDPDSNLIQNGAPDAVALWLDQTLVDSVSYEGDTAAPYTEGSGAGLEDDYDQAEMGIARCPDGIDTDQNNVDFVLELITPGRPNACGAGQLLINEIDYDQPGTDTEEFIELMNVGDASLNLDAYSLEFVNGATGVPYASIDLPSVDLAAGDYYVVCGDQAMVANCDLDVSPDTNLIQNGTPDAVALWFEQDLIDTVSYEGDTGHPYTEGSGAGLVDDPDAGAVGISRCPNGNDTNQNNVDFAMRAGTPGSSNACSLCGEPATPIHSIQGHGLTSPLAGATGISIEAIVTGDFQNTSTDLGGFFVQEEAADSDQNALTSEGIFVHDDGHGVDVEVGQLVRVEGAVQEYSQRTEMTDISLVRICGGGGAIAPMPLSLPLAALTDLESLEGMLITVPQTLFATEHYNLGRYGELWLSAGGRLWNPTSIVSPGAQALALQDLNDRSRLLLDDGSNVENPAVVPHLAADGTLRLGDSVENLTGALSQGYGYYRLQPTVPFDISRANQRPARPAARPAALTVGSMNVLNYFNGDGLGGGFPTARGADTEAEFVRQRDKLIDALISLKADIVGLVEIENDGYGATSAIQDLVSGLNDAVGAGTFAFVDPGVPQIGADQIAVGLIYRTTAVVPVGQAAILDASVDPRFLDTKNRPSLAQTFETLGTGERLTISVSHLKSKGSACDDIGDPDMGDGQGNCNLTRTNAALALVDWLASDPTSSGDPDVLIIGDLNAYAMEDPVTVLKNAGYEDLIARMEMDDAYSYVYGGQAGYLDHALASSQLTAKVNETTVWHINADEPRVLDYNQEFNPPYLYSPDAFRSSDHDPVLLRIGPLRRVYLPVILDGSRLMSP